MIAASVLNNTEIPSYVSAGPRWPCVHPVISSRLSLTCAIGGSFVWGRAVIKLITRLSFVWITSPLGTRSSAKAASHACKSAFWDARPPVKVGPNGREARSLFSVLIPGVGLEGVQ